MMRNDMQAWSSLERTSMPDGQPDRSCGVGQWQGERQLLDVAALGRGLRQPAAIDMVNQVWRGPWRALRGAGPGGLAAF